MSDRTLEVGIVGAGPVGLEAAICARRQDLAARVWDSGPLCGSMVDYPINMVFFTSNELLEIGNHPLVTGGPKATHGPYVWGKNGALFHDITRLRLYADGVLTSIAGRPLR